MIDHVSSQVNDMAISAAFSDEPRLWPEYHPGYFGAFVRDPNGNNVEAVHHGTAG